MYIIFFQSMLVQLAVYMHGFLLYIYMGFCLSGASPNLGDQVKVPLLLVGEDASN